MKFPLIFFLILLSQSLFSAIVLDVFIVSKRGMGKGLVLESELQESIVFFRTHEIQMVELGNGIQLDLSTRFDPAFDEMGPSSKVIVKGKLFNDKGEVLSDFFKKGIVLDLGSTFEKEFPDGSDHLVELKIIPRIQ